MPDAGRNAFRTLSNQCTYNLFLLTSRIFAIVSSTDALRMEITSIALISHTLIRPPQDPGSVVTRFVFCRLYHKSGAKKSRLFRAAKLHNYILTACSSIDNIVLVTASSRQYAS